jgi:signal transduction histidine kinase
MRALKLERREVIVAAAGAAMLVALGLALAPGAPRFVVIAAALAGVSVATLHLAPVAWTELRRRPVLGVVLLCGILVIVWVVLVVTHVVLPPPLMASPGSVFTVFDNAFYTYRSATGWPWWIGRLPLLPAVVAAIGGLVLIADAVRVQAGLAPPPRSVWRVLTASPSRATRTAVRAIPGVALVVVACVLGLGLVSRYGADLAGLLGLGAGGQSIMEALLTLAVSVWTALLLVAPVAVGLSMRLEFDRAGRAREQERLRFAAHLHDSVLQTLALIQRQAGDPAAVARLARRQEHALRAWMAGEAELSSDTIAAAVRDVVAEVEDEYEVEIELAAIGDHRIDARGEAMVAAAREALRNAARHAPGASVYVFLDVNADRAEMFIRDDGPGFDPDAVPAERRGLRDAVVGRMQVAGGAGMIESSLGEGTEVALKLPYNGRAR